LLSSGKVFDRTIYKTVLGVYRMPNSLVTGAAGFLGSHLVNDLISLGHSVVALDDLSGGFKDNIPPTAEFFLGSVCDHNLVNVLFKRYHFDHVFHLAAYAAEGLSHFIRRYNYTNNLIGSVNLINASINNSVKCFVFTSSIAVYGVGQLPLLEDTVPRPEDPYGIAKLAVEQDLRVAHDMFKLNYIIFRPHNVYGERQNIGDRYRNVVGIFMNQILKHEPLTIFGDGEQTRAFTYVSDVTPVIARSVDNPKAYGEIFNIGADVPYAVNELARTISKVMGVEAQLRYVAPRNEVKHAYSSHEKARQYLGYRPHYSLEEGLTQMSEWIKRVGSRRTSKFADIEINRGLPSIWEEEANHG
jgi:UDP-glucose 4-epimerase